MSHLKMNLDHSRLNELAAKVHETATEKGFYPAGQMRQLYELISLIESEISEALEAHRNGRHANWGNFELRNKTQDGVRNTPELLFAYAFEAEIKDTVGDELADTVIRILDMAAYKKCRVYSYDYAVWKQPFQMQIKRLTCATSRLYTAYSTNIGTDDPAKLAGSSAVRAFGERLTEIVGSLFAMSQHHGIDLMRHIEAKVRYNLTREKLHGK